MSLPYFPLYVTDFEGDTSHLTMAEDGAYNRLLRLCWRTHMCSIPNDDEWIMRRVRATKEEYESVVKPIVNEFFKVKNQRVYNPRLLAEFEKTQAKAKAARENGKKGGRPVMRMKVNNKGEPKALKSKTQEKAIQNHNHNHKEIDTNVSTKKNGSRLPVDWFLPAPWGEWALSEGYSKAHVKLEADKFKDYWIGIGGQRGAKLDWLATWRNWIRNSAESRANKNGSQVLDPLTGHPMVAVR